MIQEAQYLEKFKSKNGHKKESEIDTLISCWGGGGIGGIAIILYSFINSEIVEYNC